MRGKDNNQINIAVVGAGYWGKNLVRNFYALGALHTICDINRELGDNFREHYPAINFTDSFSSLLDNPNIDAIVVSTPASMHYQMTKEALLASKHVFTEKPLALNIEEGQNLIKVAAQKGKTLMVGHILQYHPAVNKLKELIDAGELEKIQYIYSNRLNIGKIRAEENILWSFAPHDISVILSLLNESPETVYATGGSYLQHQIPDVTITTMDFPSGVKAHIFVSWLHPFKEQKLVVVSDSKMAVFDDLSEEKLFLYPHKIEWINRIPVASRAGAEIVPIQIEEPLKAECQHFLECISNGTRPKTDGEEGLRVLQILHAAQESLNRNGATISLVKSEEVKVKSFSPYASRLTPHEVFIHESSYIDEDVEIGPGTRIWHFSHILRGSRIGHNCNIGQNVVIGPNVSVGNSCKIQNNISIYEGVTLEDDVFCGPSMVFTNVFNPRAAIPRMKELRLTLIKRGATIGANATIVCGLTVGEYAFIGAGAVVTRDIPDYALVLGNPARLAGWMCTCGVKLKFDKENVASCRACGRRFKKLNETKIHKEPEQHLAITVPLLNPKTDYPPHTG